MAADYCNDPYLMPWNGTEYSWVNTGRTSSMIFACTPYDPEKYAPRWYNRLALVIISISNSLAILMIALRTYFRWRKLKKFGKDDWWLLAAGLLITGVYFPALLVSSKNGIGLFVENIPFENRQALWLSMSGWAFYFIIASMIKVGTCMYYVRIIPDHRTRLLHFVYVLATAIMILGFIEAGLWMFNCDPVESNFIYNYTYDFVCPSTDKARWSWIIFSIIVDLMILWVPWRILRGSGLPRAERRVLKLVFAANMLGTMVCISNIYGVLVFEGIHDFHDNGWGDDFTHSEAAFILINNAEVLMYVVGACFPVLSPYLVSLARSHAGSNRRKSTSVQSWRISQLDNYEAQLEARRESNAKKYGQDGLSTVMEGDEEATIAPPMSSNSEDRRLGTATTMVVSLTTELGETGLGLLKRTADGEYTLAINIPEEAHTRSTRSSIKGPVTDIERDLEKQ